MHGLGQGRGHGNGKGSVKTQGGGIGTVLCTCAGRMYSPREIARIESRVGAGGLSGGGLVVKDLLCAGKEAGSVARWARRNGLTGIVFAGCSPLRAETLLQSIAGSAGIPPHNTRWVDVSGFPPGSRNKTKEALQVIDRALRSVSLIPRFQVRRIPLDQTVLIVGGGPAGTMVAAALQTLGHPTVRLGSGKSAALRDRGEVLRVQGQVGGFAVSIRGSRGREEIACGAVVLAEDALTGLSAQAPFDGDSVLPLGELERVSSALPRRREAYTIGLVLDYRIDETVASTEQALTLALELRRGTEDRPSRYDVHLFCRDIRVAAVGLETLYDKARDAGVGIVKYDGALRIAPAEKGGAAICCRDSLMGAETCLACSLVGVSESGVSVAADPELARLFGVSTDSLGQLQPNNVTLFPGQTNRPGIFAVGPCRGQPYLPRIRTDADATALTVHSLLSPGHLVVELSQPVVDPEKCALCLTCVRSCPHGAMAVDRQKGVAASSPEACQRCGICAGECPARAIELPAYSEKVLLSTIG
jgi:heterodisulfide reductase subunit A-like polyferredoxin